MTRVYLCPHCNKETSLKADNEWRPFCSERCSMVDLGGWMDERNKIASEPADFTIMEDDNGETRH